MSSPASLPCSPCDKNTEPFSPDDPSAGKTYDRVDSSKIVRVEIFPPIAIARVGDSGAYSGQCDESPEIEYFYSPEVPGLDYPFISFREGEGERFRFRESAKPYGIKRQAARFRVYAYGEDGKILGEINNTQGYQLTWTVHVANKKAAFSLSRGRFSEPTTGVRNPDIEPFDNPSGDPFDMHLEDRKRLIIDPGKKTIVHNNDNNNKNNPNRVPLNGKFQGSAAEPVDVNLGELRTDSQGRLIFLAGSGHARSVKIEGGLSQKQSSQKEPSQETPAQKQPNIISQFDSVDWYDNTCDGWVSVSVSYYDPKGVLLKLSPPHKATVICGPPKFAWGIESPTSLYDIIEDLYKQHCAQYRCPRTDFFKHIWPVLYGTYKLSWVNEKAFQGHGPSGFGNFWPQKDILSKPQEDDPSKPREDEALQLRSHIFSRLREPNYKNKDQDHVSFMPRLSGDQGDAREPGTVPRRDPDGTSIKRFAALTGLQYERFREWKDGNFIKGEEFGTLKAIEDYKLEEQPAILTRAALEHTIGDPLYPGIETYWIMKCEETFCMQDKLNDKKSVYLDPPFRVNHDKVLPGFLTRGLSLPWQSDFSLCNTHWWPSARPDEVVVPAVSPKNQESLQNWLSTADLTQLPRRKWTQGLRDNPDDLSFFPGSTDMVHQWQNLGFVAKFKPDPHMPPVWLEVERNPITRQVN